MKVEKSYTINGVVVREHWSSDKITVYVDDSYNALICYFVDTETLSVILKQTIETDMSQGTGFVSNLTFNDKFKE